MNCLLLVPALLWLPAVAPPSPPPKTTRLVVKVAGLRNDRGVVAALLFAGEAGFPDDAKRALDRQTVLIYNKAATLALAAVPPGEYAIVLLHDENKNGKMGTSFGFPTEGFGVSNNPKTGWKAPRWPAAKFTVAAGDGSERVLVVRIVYL